MKKARRALTAICLVLVLTVVTACSGSGGSTTAELPRIGESQLYSQLEHGSTTVGQNYGQWVLQTAQGLVQDAYVRDNNKLGVVISPRVKPSDVRVLARSLMEGFHKNFPRQDLTVLVYAPDKQLILTAEYDQQSNQIHYQAA